MKDMFVIIFGVICLYVLLQAIYSGYFFYKAQSLIKKVYVGEVQLGDKNHPKFNLLIDGDSVGAGVGASTLDKSVAGRVASFYSEKYYVDYVNDSKVGARMEDLVNKPVPLQRQNVTLLVISSNDLFHFSNLNEFKTATEKVLKKYSGFSDKVILIGPGRVFDAAAIPFFIKPVYKIYGSKYAKVIETEAKKYPNVIYVNPLNTSVSKNNYGNTNASDGFHPNDEGHRFWFDLIRSHL